VLAFVISVLVAAYFVVEMVAPARTRRATQPRARGNLRNNVVRSACRRPARPTSQTPLSTLAVVIGELRHDTALPGGVTV
jgi:hypothetical protein